MLSKETLIQEDQTLATMYKADTEGGQKLSPEDEQAYRELINQQKSSLEPTRFEVRGNNHIERIAPSIGDAALTNTKDAMAVHSEDWHTEAK